MKNHRSCIALCFVVLAEAWAPSALALANRVFVSARSGNNANSCDNISTPCQTLTGALAQLNPDGEAIVLDSGGYGAVTITQGVTIEAPAGVTAFIHPSSGDAITITAGTGTVTLRGLVLHVGTNNGIMVNSVGTLNVENCFISGFARGIEMVSAGRLNVKGTEVTACDIGILIVNDSGLAQVSVDHCHLDGNFSYGYIAGATLSGSSTTTASYTTANHNSNVGWDCGSGTSGKNVLNLEFCTGSENFIVGLLCESVNAQTAARYSNCVFTNNGSFGVGQESSGSVQTRGNNTITGNGTAPTSGTIGTFSPM